VTWIGATFDAGPAYAADRSAARRISSTLMMWYRFSIETAVPPVSFFPI